MKTILTAFGYGFGGSLGIAAGMFLVTWAIETRKSHESRKE